MTRGCYPGSFDPLTTAHVAIIDAAYEQCGLTSLDCVVSRVALAKEHGHSLSLDERLRAIESTAVDGRPWLHWVVTDLQLVVDIAAGYDVLVLGFDKLAQVLDPSFYGGSVRARDDAVARLPKLAVAPRGAIDLRVQVLDTPSWARDVSSSAVRAGADQWRAWPQTRQNPE